MTRSGLVAAASVALLTACASPGLLLDGRGDAFLVRDAERLRLSPDDALIVSWVAGDAVHSTDELTSLKKGRTRLVRLVEASSDFLHVWSDDWNEPGDLSRDLVRGDVRLVPRSGRYKHPTLLIPVAQVVSVDVYRLLPRRHRPRWGDAWRGMGAAATAAMVGFASIASEPGEPAGDDGADFLLGTLLVGAAGGIAYPAYHLFPARYAEDAVVYDVGPDGPYRIEVAPPR